MAYQFVYFDLDDTLLDHKAAESAGLKDVHEHFSFFNGTTADDLIEVYHEVNSRQWSLYSQGEVSRQELQRNRFEQTLQQLNLDASRHEEVGNHYMKCYRDHWQWIDGAEQAYKAVRDNYPVGVLTNGFAETQRKKFEQFGFYESANHTVISEDVGVLKPDPKIFEHATKLAGVDPSDILYVGDSFSSDIQGGSRFGWHTAWYTRNGQTDQHQKAELVFNNFQQLMDLLEV